MSTPTPATVAPATDDGPFLYLRQRGLPFLPYGAVLLGLLVASVVLLRIALGRGIAEELLRQLDIQPHKLVDGLADCVHRAGALALQVYPCVEQEAACGHVGEAVGEGTHAVGQAVAGAVFGEPGAKPSLNASYSRSSCPTRASIARSPELDMARLFGMVTR